MGRIRFIIVMILGVMSQFATEIYIPSMPTMMHYFKVHPNLIQLTIAFYTFGFACSAIYIGYFSDKFGRRKVLIPSLIISLIGSTTCCFATSIHIMFLGRFIQGFGLAGLSVSARSIIRDIATSTLQLAKLASLISIFATIALAGAPLIGGYIEQYFYWRLNFIILFALNLIIFIMVIFFLEESSKNKFTLPSVKDIVFNYKSVLFNKKFIYYNLIGTLTLCGMTAYQTISSFLLETYAHVQPEHYGYTSIAVMAALIFGNIYNTKSLMIYSNNQMMMLGSKLFVIAGILYIGFGLFNYTNVISVLIPILIYSFSAGITYPNATANALSLFTDKAGTASSVYSSIQMSGAALGSLSMSIVKVHNTLPIGLLIFLLGIFTVLFCLFINSMKTTTMHNFN